MHDLLSRQLAQLNQNDKRLDELYHHYAVSVDISDASLWILYIIRSQDEALTQKQLCDLWGYCRQTINTALKNLERQALITLVPVAANRKSKKIVFTDKGISLAESIVDPLLRAESASFRQMSEQERETLTILSAKRTALLQKEMQKAICERAKANRGENSDTDQKDKTDMPSEEQQMPV